MNADEVTGERLGPRIAAALAPYGARDPLYPLLLAEPVLLAFLSHEAAAGPSVRLTGGALTRLVESPALKVPAVPLYVSATALRASARDRGYWPDDVERAAVFEKGAIFPILRGHPGAVLVAGGVRGRPRRRRARRPGRPSDPRRVPRRLEDPGHQGPRPRSRHPPRQPPSTSSATPTAAWDVLFQREESTVFLHLASAERFAQRVPPRAASAAHGLVAGADLFKNAFRGKLHCWWSRAPSHSGWAERPALNARLIAPLPARRRIGSESRPRGGRGLRRAGGQMQLQAGHELDAGPWPRARGR